MLWSYLSSLFGKSEAKGPMGSGQCLLEDLEKNDTAMGASYKALQRLPQPSADQHHHYTIVEREILFNVSKLAYDLGEYLKIVPASSEELRLFLISPAVTRDTAQLSKSRNDCNGGCRILRQQMERMQLDMLKIKESNERMDGAARARRYAMIRATMEPAATGLTIASTGLTAVGMCTAYPPLAVAGMSVAILRGFIALGLFVLGRMEQRVKTGLVSYNTPVNKLLPLLIQHMQLMVSKAENISAILDLLEKEHADNRCSSQAAKLYRMYLIDALGHMPRQCKDLGVILDGWYKWASRNAGTDRAITSGIQYRIRQ